MLYRAELHVHTLLSPCAEVEMMPPLIIQEALERGISILGITDHNTTGNLGAMVQAAEGTGITIIPGMELQTREEVHLLCLFADLDTAMTWGRRVESLLPPIKNQPDHFGEQFLVDETGAYLGSEDRLLIVSAQISLDDAVREVQHMGGLAIPAHVDRKAFGLIANLGFFPENVPIEAVEISRHLVPQSASRVYPQLAGYPLLRGGDAHRLNELLGANQFNLLSPTLSEIRLALANQEGRALTLLDLSC